MNLFPPPPPTISYRVKIFRCSLPPFPPSPNCNGFRFEYEWIHKPSFQLSCAICTPPAHCEPPPLHPMHLPPTPYDPSCTLWSPLHSMIPPSTLKKLESPSTVNIKKLCKIAKILLPHLKCLIWIAQRIAWIVERILDLRRRLRFVHFCLSFFQQRRSIFGHHRFFVGGQTAPEPNCRLEFRQFLYFGFSKIKFMQKFKRNFGNFFISGFLKSNLQIPNCRIPNRTA